MARARPEPFVLERVQALSHRDLRRLIPRLFPEAGPPCWHGCHCTISFRGGHQLLLELGPEAERRLGSLRVVSTHLRLSFKTWPATEIETAVTRVEQALHQGGG